MHCVFFFRFNWTGFGLGDLDTVHCTGGKERKKLEFTLRDIKWVNSTPPLDFDPFLRYISSN